MTEEFSIFYIKIAWHKYKTLAWARKTGDIRWIMRPCLPLNKLDDNEDVYLEFEALYDYNLSNVWELYTENVLTLYNRVTLTGIANHKNCYFDRKKRAVRFEFGKFGAIRDEIAPSRDFKNLVFLMRINVMYKSIVGMQITPTECFFEPKNIDSEVSLNFLESGPDNHPCYIHRLALTTVSSKFCEILSNEPNSNGEYVIEDIYNYTNFEKYKSKLETLRPFLRLLYRLKEEFTIDKIEGIVFLAARFDVQFLIADCEDFLISNREISNAKKLCIAEECNLPKLQLIALKKIKIEFFLHGGFTVFHEMGPKTLQALLVKFVKDL